MKHTIRNFQNFQKQFPSDGACLDYIFINTGRSCANCTRGQLYRVSGRKCYGCSVCGYQVHPLAGTIFEKSSTPLSLWFYAIYIMAQSKNTLSAKDLERHLGVTYKTAWRMCKQIRGLVVHNKNKDIITNDFKLWIKLLNQNHK